MSSTPQDEALFTVPPPPPPLARGHQPRATPRNTVRDTWAWLWKDTLGRVVPFALVGAVYTWKSRTRPRPAAAPRGEWLRDGLAGIALGIPMALIAALFRGWVAPRYRVPTPADQTLQTAFYFAVNAPAEELLWRRTVQTLSIGGLRRVPGIGQHASWLGWTLTSLAFGAYHRLGHWSWRSIAGVTVAGSFFGALYQWQPRRHSLLLPVLVHGFATAGFLSWGDVFLHQREMLKGKQREGEDQ